LSFQRPSPGEPLRRPAFPQRRRSRALLPTVGILAAFIVLFSLFAGYWTDLLWFRSVDYQKVFTTQLVTKLGMFVVFGLLMAVIVGANIVVAYRLRPAFRGMSLEQQSLDRYRTTLEPFRRVALIVVAGGLGLIAGSTAAGEWRTWLQWRNATPFGVKDHQFHKDVGFYAFSYPWWRFLLGFAFAAVILSLLSAVATHYLYGGLRLQTPGDKASPAAQAHLSLLLGLFVLLKAVAYWLDRYGLAIGPDKIFDGWTGLKYKDVNAVLPAKTILFAIALICALLFFANVFRRTWMLPGIGFGLLVLSAVLIGGVYPAIVQQFQVRPSEADKEAPYITRNIEATRQAYGLDKVQVRDYNAKTTATAGQLRNDADTTASIRLLDPSKVSPTFEQLQQIRGYYNVADPLDIDRYMVDGKLLDTVLAARELDLGGIPESNWVNEHLKYTHGFGLIAARGNTRGAKGEPVFTEAQIPPSGALGKFEPRIYFGEKSPSYSIVGAPAGAAPTEIDYPDDKSPNGQQNNTYQGSGGVPVGSLFNKLLYAMKFREEKILLSSAVNSDSKILYLRNPRDRVEHVAPWLTLDSDPYPAIVDGKILWIIDGYTSTNSYPYSARTTLGEATTDSLTTTQRQVLAPRDQVNYIRNSVKATVDAYDGTVTLYTWDESDPVLQTWKKAFPGTVKDKSAIDDSLMAHLRYPEDLFKVQRDLMARYHVTDAQAFYGGQDYWKIPADPTGGSGTGSADQPPYYLTLQMPGQEKPTFSLSSTFVPNKRPNLAAFMAVNSAPGPDFGTIRVLKLPSNTAIPGPGQVQNTFSSDPAVADVIRGLRSGDAEVRYGNLLTLPVGGGLLYVEPVYVQASAGTSYPLLRKVLVAFGTDIAFKDTLQEALNTVFSGNAGSPTGEGTTPPATGGPPATGQPPAGAATNAELKQALADANQALKDSEAALKAGDFAAYGAAQKRLQDAINRALRAEAQASQAGQAPPSGASPTPTTTPTTGPTTPPPVGSQPAQQGPSPTVRPASGSG
jgi:uncharacterized membrane protein (UPF0182 family)